MEKHHQYIWMWNELMWLLWYSCSTWVGETPAHMKIWRGTQGNKIYCSYIKEHCLVQYIIFNLLSYHSLIVKIYRWCLKFILLCIKTIALIWCWLALALSSDKGTFDFNFFRVPYFNISIFVFFRFVLCHLAVCFQLQSLNIHLVSSAYHFCSSGSEHYVDHCIASV